MTFGYVCLENFSTFLKTMLDDILEFSQNPKHHGKPDIVMQL